MRKNSKQTHSRGYSTSTAEDHQGDEKQGKTGKLSWTRGDHGDVTTNAMWCPGLDPRTEKTHKKQTNKQTQVFFSSPCVSLLCVSFIRPLLLDLSPNQIIQNNLILKSLISLYQQRPFFPNMVTFTDSRSYDEDIYLGATLQSTTDANIKGRWVKYK